MNKIPTICYEDIYEFCASLNFEFENRYEMADEDDTISISVVAKYDNARNIINILTGYGYEIANMEFHDPEYDGYKDEYIITICVRLSNNDIMEIWCEPAKRKDDYLILGGDIVYILNECNIKVVKKIESDKIYFVELEDEIEDEYDDFADDLECGNCEECHIFDDSDMEENDKDDEYVNLKLTRDEMETLHMLCHIFDV